MNVWRRASAMAKTLSDMSGEALLLLAGPAGHAAIVGALRARRAEMMEAVDEVDALIGEIAPAIHSTEDAMKIPTTVTQPDGPPETMTFGQAIGRARESLRKKKRQGVTTAPAVRPQKIRKIRRAPGGGITLCAAVRKVLAGADGGPLPRGVIAARLEGVGLDLKGRPLKHWSTRISMMCATQKDMFVSAGRKEGWKLK